MSAILAGVLTPSNKYVRVAYPPRNTSFQIAIATLQRYSLFLSVYLYRGDYNDFCRAKHTAIKYLGLLIVRELRSDKKIEASLQLTNVGLPSLPLNYAYIVVDSSQKK